MYKNPYRELKKDISPERMARISNLIETSSGGEEVTQIFYSETISILARMTAALEELVVVIDQSRSRE